MIVIVSAMSGKTNELVGWVNETSPLFDAREYDAVLASGETVTAGLMALRLQEMNIPARDKHLPCRLTASIMIILECIGSTDPIYLVII